MGRYWGRFPSPKDAAETLATHPEERRQQAAGAQERSRSAEHQRPEADDEGSNG